MDNTMRIGGGTMLTTCGICGKSLLSGELRRHLSSGECRRIGEKNRTQEEINELKKDVEKLKKRQRRDLTK